MNIALLYTTRRLANNNIVKSLAIRANSSTSAPTPSERDTIAKTKSSTFTKAASPRNRVLTTNLDKTTSELIMDILNAQSSMDLRHFEPVKVSGGSGVCAGM